MSGPIVSLADILPTMPVKLKDGGHDAVINVADFDPKLHEKPKEKGEKASKDPAAAAGKPDKGGKAPPRVPIAGGATKDEDDEEEDEDDDE